MICSNCFHKKACINTMAAYGRFVTGVEYEANADFKCEHYINEADVQEVNHASHTKNDCCTNCGSARATDNRYGHIPKNEIIFCYHCGAKMDGE